MLQGHVLLYAALAIAAVFVIAQVLQHPGQVLWKLLKSVALGCLFILGVNWVGQFLHYHLPFNALTALTAGFLGLPGVGMLIALQLWLYH